MKIAYLDCASGISGDMLLGALVDAGVPLHYLNEAVGSLGVAELSLSSEVVDRGGFRAVKIEVSAHEEHVHRHLGDILEMIDGSTVLTHAQKLVASQLFQRIAVAEAKVHGIDVEKVHFHEVGAVDSIADIVASVVGLEYLNLDELIASNVPVGCGTIRIAHGTCSLPAPATAELLRGIPIAASDVPFELTTPTGAAILSAFVRRYGPIPALSIEKIGYGAGTRNLPQQPNVLRLILGEIEEQDLQHIREYRPPNDTDPNYPPLSRTEVEPHAHHHHEHHHHEHHHHEHHEHEVSEEQVWMLETNLDDLSGELLGYCIEGLWKLDVLDVYTIPIFMKKNRPGSILCVMCHENQVSAVQRLLFRETSTLGIRKHSVTRAVLHRETHSVQTPWGLVRGKLAFGPEGARRFTPEYESAKEIAEKENLPLRIVYEKAIQKYHETE